jgi:uncharacterized membrane protein YgcG
MHPWSKLGAAFLLAVLAVGVPTIAYAESPVTFGASHIVDKTGALGNREGEVAAAITKLATDTGTDLFVAYVDTFTGVANREEWADQTADKNGMGTNDVLLAIATGDRQYQLSVSPNFKLTDAQLSEIESVAIEPPLRENDWAGAAIGTANGLSESLQGKAVTTPQIVPGKANPGSGGGGFGVVIGILIVIVAVGLIIFLAMRRRRKKAGGAVGAPDAVQSLPTPQLKQQAGSALVQTDDAVKTSGQELGFAVAQYGEAATTAFQTALAEATALLRQAFTLQQKLDDSEPDTEQQQRAWYAEILQLCGSANATLDEQAADFDALRQLEKNAPQAAATVAAAATEVESRIAAAEASLADLSARYTPTSIATVADNPAQARERVTFAGTALTEANSRLAAGDTGAAAVGIRAAEESVDQAKLLLDAVDRLSADLQQAAATVGPAITDLETDLVAARSLPVSADGASASLPSVIAQTEQTLTAVKARLAAGPINPIELVQTLEAANTPMDAALQGVRDAAMQMQRAQAALSQTLLAARSQVSAAEDFITARRGAVGAEARTRLAEAGRLVVQADSLAASDPANALAAAQRADALAAEAIRLAQNDVNGFNATNGGGFGGLLGGGSGGGNSGGGNGAMGAVLGGILINSILGGGGSSRGGGGSRGGSTGGGSRSGGGPRSAGSFGGGGTRSRRGGGGRF